MPVEALNWLPARDSNSIAVLAVHDLHATRLWLAIAVGAPLPDRDRESEFFATATEAVDFVSIVEDLSRDCRSLLESAHDVDWSAQRDTLGRGGDAPPQVAAAYALVHATEHLRGHVDQISLTRRLWEQRASS